MVDFDCDFADCRQLAKTARFRTQRKSDELHRTYLIRRHLAFIEAGADAASVKNDPQMALQTHQAGKFRRRVRPGPHTR